MRNAIGTEATGVQTEFRVSCRTRSATSDRASDGPRASKATTAAATIAERLSPPEYRTQPARLLLSQRFGRFEPRRTQGRQIAGQHRDDAQTARRHRQRRRISGVQTKQQR